MKAPRFAQVVILMLAFFSVSLWVRSAASPVLIGNRVWHDLNRNGIQDPNEPGVSGVTVRAYRAADNLLLDTQTTRSMAGADGCYAFSFDGPEAVYLIFELPRGFVFAPHHQGPDSALDSDADCLTGRTGVIRLDASNPSSRSQPQWDAGLLNKLYEQTGLDL
jgi:hypothetical protein